MNRRLLFVLWAATTLALVLFLSHPAAADYSDHGTVNSTHPSAPPVERSQPPDELERTGADHTAAIRLGVLLVAGGAALVLAVRKHEGRST